METHHSEPISMPLRKPGWRPAAEQFGQRMGMCVRRARAESNRLRELLHAAGTHEGRQRNLAPLLTLAASSAFLLGVTWGLSRRRRSRS